LQPHFHTGHEAFDALISGDEKALEYFFNLHYTSLVFYARSITKNELASEDIAIESFSKLWSRSSSLKHPPQVKHFLYLVARNACIDFLRSQNNLKKVQASISSYSSLSQSSHIETIIASETYRNLYRLITFFPPKTRQVFCMFHFGQKSTKQIAAELSITINTVKEHKKRAIRFLRENSAQLNLVLLLLSLISIIGY
jgi:RNA polymerase sigma-70 factor (ECF subfamily)